LHHNGIAITIVDWPADGTQARVNTLVQIFLQSLWSCDSSQLRGSEEMSQSRIEVFKEMLQQQPDEVMVWYGLATEYSKLGNWREAAEALQNVTRLNADYTAAYQMLGTALMNLGDREKARKVWSAGLEAANRTGAWKARQHLESLLAESANSPSELCK
jgi:predicted Zn-dependent protease